MFRNIEDLYTTISIVLHWQDHTKTDAKVQPELVRNALKQQRTLLIDDNLETVDDEKVTTFRRELPAPTKAIITTRHRVDVAYPIRLRGMEENEAGQLIQHECEKRNLVLTEKEMDNRFERQSMVYRDSRERFLGILDEGRVAQQYGLR